MELSIFAGPANQPLAESIAERLGIPLSPRSLTRFPDTELHLEVQDSVRGRDVYLVQPTGPPVSEHLPDLISLFTG